MWACILCACLIPHQYRGQFLGLTAHCCRGDMRLATRREYYIRSDSVNVADAEIIRGSRLSSMLTFMCPMRRTWDPPSFAAVCSSGAKFENTTVNVRSLGFKCPRNAYSHTRQSLDFAVGGWRSGDSCSVVNHTGLQQRL